DLVEVDYEGTSGTTWLEDVSVDGNASSENSRVATLGYYNNPTISTARGFTYLPASVDFQFDTGTSSLTLGPSIDTTYYIKDTGIEIEVVLTQVGITGGAW